MFVLEGDRGKPVEIHKVVDLFGLQRLDYRDWLFLVQAIAHLAVFNQLLQFLSHFLLDLYLLFISTDSDTLTGLRDYIPRLVPSLLQLVSLLSKPIYLPHQKIQNILEFLLTPAHAMNSIHNLVDILVFIPD